MLIFEYRCYETNFYLRIRAIGLPKNNVKNHKYPNPNISNDNIGGFVYFQ